VKIWGVVLPLGAFRYTKKNTNGPPTQPKPKKKKKKKTKKKKIKKKKKNKKKKKKNPQNQILQNPNQLNTSKRE